MSTLEVAFLNSQLEERKRRLEMAIALAPQSAGLAGLLVGSSRVDLQACKLEYSIVSPK